MIACPCGGAGCNRDARVWFSSSREAAEEPSSAGNTSEVIPSTWNTGDGTEVRPGLTGDQKVTYGSPVDAVFRALADPTRRRLLDALFKKDGQALSTLEAR